MNRTITTSTTRRQCLHQSLRQYLRPAALALITLLALVATSCTADPLDNPDPAAGNGNGNSNPDGIITFAIAPRPGFTEVPVSGDAPASADAPATRSIPATRAEQTDNATRWQTGDILWLDVRLYRDKQDRNTLDTLYISALKYDGTEWRYLTEAEAEDLNTGNIPDFSRLVRLPRGWEDWPAPGMKIAAYYAGSGKPDADGTLTIIPAGEIPTTPLIGGVTQEICSLDGEPVPLKLVHYCSRVRIPAGCKVELTTSQYFPAIGFSPNKGIYIVPKLIAEIPEQSEDTDVFLHLTGTPTAKLTRGDVSCTFTFPFPTDAEGNPITSLDGNPIRDGASYTLTPYTSGTQSPVADYDLTIATETELRNLAQAVNAGEKLPNGKLAAEARVLQTENIELTKEWVPIGSGVDNPFRGAYNGNGHKITGLTITTAPPADTDDDSYAGLFGRAEGAVLTGIRLQDVRIDTRNMRVSTRFGDPTQLCIGSVAGRIENTTLSLCSAAGIVNASGGTMDVYAGGIVGINRYSTISRCQTNVETTAAATDADGEAYAGGITGWNGVYSFILSCETQSGAVTAEGGDYIYAGGITGQNSSISLIAFSRTGENTVTARNAADTNYAGGLVGINWGSLYSCYSRATATAPEDAGTIAGYNTIEGSVQHCYGAGATGKGSSNLDADQVLNIVYNTNPDAGEIYRVMTGYEGKVESLTDHSGTYYPYTTHYNPSATPAYGIIPQRAVWTKDAWKDGGTDPKFPEINFDYEGGNNE